MRSGSPGHRRDKARDHIDPGHHLEQLAGEMGRGAGPADHVDLAGIGLRIGDELGNGFRRKRRIDDHDVGSARARDWRHVAEEIELEIVIERALNAFGGRRQSNV